MSNIEQKRILTRESLSENETFKAQHHQNDNGISHDLDLQEKEMTNEKRDLSFVRQPIPASNAHGQTKWEKISSFPKFHKIPSQKSNN